MKEYMNNKNPKDPRFLAAFRKSFNNDRKRNGLTVEESANELGMSLNTYEAKLKPSKLDSDITVTDWSHHLDISGDFTTLEYFAAKHGFRLEKLEVCKTNKSIHQISAQTDTAFIEFSEAFKATKQSLEDEVLTSKEKYSCIREIDEAVKELEQLREDVNNKDEL